ncbi:hypothetical protein [Actinomadura litoris]|uniref:hypothetical protein n=1 Tax=Actinomadura litoris TaxID=2678616 RepID=UPI001FA7D47B|nr:hypothetical protein [Actinomadura litoris]
MSEYQPGEIVDIHIKGARVVNSFGTSRGNVDGLIQDTGTVLVFAMDGALYKDTSHTVNMGDPGVTVERVAPAEWPPRPRDVWGTDDGGRWFAARYMGDFDDSKDFEGCNSEGWRVVLIPLDVGPYGDAREGHPDEVRQLAGRPMFLVHREDEPGEEGSTDA